MPSTELIGAYKLWARAEQAVEASEYFDYLVMGVREERVRTQLTILRERDEREREEQG